MMVGLTSSIGGQVDTIMEQIVTNLGSFAQITLTELKHVAYLTKRAKPIGDTMPFQMVAMKKNCGVP